MTRRTLQASRILVTGASSGIGRALSHALARAGSRLVVTARRADRLQLLVGELQARGAEAVAVPGDITAAETRHICVSQAERNWGGLDILVNNAGVGAVGPFSAASSDRLRRVMEVNFFAPVELTRQALPLLRQGTRPLIVNIGSVLGHRAVAQKSEYCAAKFALHGFSDALRAELAQEGIDVLLVSPSTTRSEFFEQTLAGARDAGSPRRGMSPARVAQRAVQAMRRGKHEVILSAGGKALVWGDRLLPTLMDWILAKAANTP